MLSECVIARIVFLILLQRDTLERVDGTWEASIAGRLPDAIWSYLTQVIAAGDSLSEGSGLYTV